MSTGTLKWQILSFCCALKLRYSFMAHATLPRLRCGRQINLVDWKDISGTGSGEKRLRSQAKKTPKPAKRLEKSLLLLVSCYLYVLPSR